VAFQKGLGAIHALSHPVGAIYNTHHGMTNAVVMPYVLKFNRPAIESRIERVSAYLGIAGGFDGFYDHLMAMRESFGVPSGLSGLGVDAKQIETLAAAAIVDPCAGGNPVELTLDAARDLYEQCI
ncbi:MAG: iron-containing alcohol dehydrogenase, partial [Parvibaculaceae bacterium]|nr:iron-containing alcohol dehydrogenase [Parvibaculaceae bacterium]